jgi:hypothetical protein
MVGKLLKKKAKIILHYGYDPKNIVLSQPFPISKSENEDSIIPRMWAQAKVDAIHTLNGENAVDEMAVLGRKFEMVTPGSSLLVLTTLEQFKEHKIAPPASTLPNIHTRWVEEMKKEKINEEKKKQNKMDKVKTWINGRKELLSESADTYKKYCESKWKDKHGIKTPKKDVPKGHGAGNYDCGSDDEDCGSDDEDDDDDYGEDESMPVTAAKGTVTMKAWIPDVEYINAIKKHHTLPDQYSEYIKQRKMKDRQSSPAFFNDCAIFFFSQSGGSEIATRILSTISDLNPSNPK